MSTLIGSFITRTRNVIGNQAGTLPPAEPIRSPFKINAFKANAFKGVT